MDKRFFLALFLSLVVIAVSQLLFPPAKRPPATNLNLAKDSTAMVPQAGAATSSSTAPTVQDQRTPGLAVRAPGASENGRVPRQLAETTEVVTGKATYEFTNLGAAPVSIVLRDYVNRSSAGGTVDLAAKGSPLLAFKLVTATDTADLSGIVFSGTRSVGTRGEEILTYQTSVRSLSISIAYAISKDTSSSYVVSVNGRVGGAAGQAYILVQMPRTLRSAEADTVVDLRSLAYTFKPDRDHARSVLFGSLDPGEKTLEPGPLSWVAVKNKYFVFGVLAPPNGGSFS